MSWMLIVPHFLGDHTALLQGSPLRVSKWSLGKDYLEIESDVEECLKKLAFISSSLRNSAEMIFFFHLRQEQNSLLSGSKMSAPSPGLDTWTVSVEVGGF
jgi:hypothetical protein